MSSPCRFLDRFQPPLPPAELRARSLSAVSAALARPPVRPDPWVRLWESRPARLAWAAAVAGLVLGHVVLSLPRPQATVPSVPPFLLAGTVTDLELAETVRLPRLRSDRLPQLDPTVETPAREKPRRDRHDV